MITKQVYPITVLRVFCVFQVFFLHYLAGHGGRDCLYLFNGAVPSFLLMSAFLYGMREERNYGKHFLKKRFYSLAATYYPFLILTFAWFVFTDFPHIKENAFALFCDLTFLNGFGSNLPECGHLWFMPTLMSCYIALIFTTNNRLICKMFASMKGVLLIMTLVILGGFIYRGANTVYIFAYILLFFNARKLLKLNERSYLPIIYSLFLLGCYLLLANGYEKSFHYGIYLNFQITCLIAVITILLFTNLLSNIRPNAFIIYLSNISMEIYLIHHLFVFNLPLYISLPVTLILAVLLHLIGERSKILISKYTK